MINTIHTFLLENILYEFSTSSSFPLFYAQPTNGVMYLTNTEINNNIVLIFCHLLGLLGH